ncbi:thiamine phosphate synthase [Roseibium sp.]|uniref:thiamine phosphate synthase n=1 Tax=Roseibium sp. TaxID=1936156 RepID=UPI003A96D621
MKLDPFYLIVDKAEWIDRLGPLGLKLAQLRLKDLPAAEIRQQIRDAKRAADKHGVTLVINDYWDMAIDEGCAWVHLGQEDLDDADLAVIRSAGLKLGLSTHDGAELDRALAAEPDYIALGPVFETTVKELKWAPQGIDRLATWKERAGSLPLVAIGGMTPERADAALRAGADSVAVVTDVLANADPEARTCEWLEVTAFRR